MMKRWKGIKNFFKEKQREDNLDWWDNEFFNFLKTIFIMEQAYESLIKKRLKLTDKKFESFCDMASQKGFIEHIIEKEPLYTLSSRGIRYLMESKKIQKQEKISHTMMWATIILAFSALISTINLLLKEPETKNTIVKFSLNILSISLLGLSVMFVIAILIILLYWILNKLFKKKK